MFWRRGFLRGSSLIGEICGNYMSWRHSGCLCCWEGVYLAVRSKITLQFRSWEFWSQSVDRCECESVCVWATSCWTLSSAARAQRAITVPRPCQPISPRCAAADQDRCTCVALHSARFDTKRNEKKDIGAQEYRKNSRLVAKALQALPDTARVSALALNRTDLSFAGAFPSKYRCLAI